MKFRLQTYDEVASTNDVVKRALEAGEPEGLAVGALVQTAGYGRQGRAWASPVGGMYVSLLLRPAVPVAQLPTLSLVAGIAVRRAIAAVAPQSADCVQVKWPNDVVLVENGDEGFGSAVANGTTSSPFRKLCGISMEAHAGGVCVGIGVNVVPPDAAPQVGGKNAPAYVSELVPKGVPAPGIEDVRAAVLSAFSACYDTWCAEGFAAFTDEFSAHATLAGRTVRVENLDGSVIAAGEVRGIDEHARLLVQPEHAAEPVAVSSGEAHITSAR